MEVPKKNLEPGDSMRGQTLSPDRWVGHHPKTFEFGGSHKLTIPKRSPALAELPGTWCF